MCSASTSTWSWFGQSVTRRCSRWHEHCPCSVINGLTDYAHPCQALADLYTIRELAGPLKGRTMAWIGDANNVALSLALAGLR